MQRVEALEVRVHRGQQRFGRLLFFKNYLLHCGQHIDRRGKARAVQAPVVILAAERNVPLALEAALEEERKERRGDRIQPAPLVERFAHERENPLPHGGEERVHIRALRELFPHNRIDDVCKRQRADIRNFHAFAGDDELPAGGHGVIARVLFVVAQRRQRGNRHVVVFILREAQAELRQPRAHFVNFQRRFAADAQVDFRVDQPQLFAGLQAEFREQVEAVFSVRCFAAQHDALPVVALLHARIKVAVAVAGEEKRLDERERGLFRFTARVEIGLQVGRHVLVEPAERVVIIALAPHREMQRAQALQRFAQRARAKARDAGERIGDFGIARAARGGLIARRQIEQRFDRAPHGGVIAPLAKPAQIHFQPVFEDGSVIRREVADAAQLVDEMMRADFVPFRFVENHRQRGHGAREGENFAVHKPGRFQPERRFQPQRGALEVGELRAAVGGFDACGNGLAGRVMHAFPLHAAQRFNLPVHEKNLRCAVFILWVSQAKRR